MAASFNLVKVPGQGYTPGNVSDVFKHSNLENLVLKKTPSIYFEFHSGAGLYGNYEGSGLRVIRKMHLFKNDYFAHLYEIDDVRRATLTEAVKEYPDVSVRKDWKDDVKWCLSVSNDSTLYLFDPTFIADYPTGLIQKIKPILKTGASLFMYVPEQVNQSKHNKIVEKIKKEIRKSKRTGVDLVHSANTGFFERRDHNIIVAKDVNPHYLLGHHDTKHIKLFGKQSDSNFIN